MNVWWCNQARGWDAEYPAGVVRSSAVAANDRFRRTVGEARRGDVIVHYRGPNVVAFSQAVEDGRWKDSLPDRYERGWEFQTSYFVLRYPIHREQFSNRIDIPRVLGFALSSSGRVNQGYFFRFSLDGLAVLLSLTSPDEQLPGWLEEIRRQVETSDGDLELLLIEGSRYRQHLRRERNPQLAEASKRIHGYICKVCGFDFEKRYGARGRHYIEAHHIVPLSEYDPEIEINLSPERDFTVVCANCHRMLHRTPYVSVEELKALIANNG
jgi:hypothetical protein